MPKACLAGPAWIGLPASSSGQALDIGAAGEARSDHIAEGRHVIGERHGRIGLRAVGIARADDLDAGEVVVDRCRDRRFVDHRIVGDGVREDEADIDLEPGDPIGGQREAPAVADARSIDGGGNADAVRMNRGLEHAGRLAERASRLVKHAIGGSAIERKGRRIDGV